MIQRSMLTLSLAEADPGSSEFEINCAELQSKSIIAKSLCAFRLTKDKIFDDEGNPKWDIGKITFLENDAQYAPNTKKENKIFMTVGNVRLRTEKDVALADLKAFLEANKSDYYQFERNTQMAFAIVKVRQIVAIDEKDGKKQQKSQMLFVDFDSDHRNEKLLNKDYRWLHYWNQIPDKQKWGKQEQIQKVLNQPGKNLYLILRRYAFKNNTNIWISGMHWL